MKGVVHVDRDGVLKRMKTWVRTRPRVRDRARHAREGACVPKNFRRRKENEEDKLYPLDDKDRAD
jgi:hypothetical protein